MSKIDTYKNRLNSINKRIDSAKTTLIERQTTRKGLLKQLKEEFNIEKPEEIEDKLEELNGLKDSINEKLDDVLEKLETNLDKIDGKLNK